MWQVFSPTRHAAVFILLPPPGLLSVFVVLCRYPRVRFLADTLVFFVFSSPLLSLPWLPVTGSSLLNGSHSLRRIASPLLLLAEYTLRVRPFCTSIFTSKELIAHHGDHTRENNTSCLYILCTLKRQIVSLLHS